MSDKPITSPNFILPPVFGGEVKESINISAREMEFRKRLKDFIAELADELDIDAPDVVTGLIPMSFEVCLEQINTEFYEEALDSYHDLWHEYYNHIVEMKKTIETAFNEVNQRNPFIKKSEMDWS